MSFKHLKEQMQKHFQKISKDTQFLFEVDLDKDELWDLYLDSFPEGKNEIFREKREYDCSCCRNFIKNIGSVIKIKDRKITTIWDFETNSPDKYQPVVEALSAYIKSKVISDVYISKEEKIGVDRNLERLESKVVQWDHFYLELPDKFVDKSSKSEGDLKGTYRATKEVFKRTLDEISKDTFETILELIYQSSLYKGNEWKKVIEAYIGFKNIYDTLSDAEKELYAWEKSVGVGEAIGRLRNRSIGVLLTDVENEIALDKAVKKYHTQIVAPEKYQRNNAIYTKKDVENAKKKLQELGFLDSLQRRYANVNDITINNVLFANKDTANKISGDIFDEMKIEVSNKPKNFSKVEEISVNTFVENILPTATSVELYLENKHSANMMSLVAPTIPDSRSMFKWGNNFSWAYAGNITDSSMKENVKSAGGNVDGVLRFSIQWNSGDVHDKNDLDAHCIEPGGNRICFANPRHTGTTGTLDVDITSPQKNKPAVENITWSDRDKMPDGKYEFIVRQHANRGGKGFRAEIGYDGDIYSFEYDKEIRQGDYVKVANVTKKDGKFTIEEILPSGYSSKDLWGNATNCFIPVKAICNSPNYWDDNEIGNKHLFFMLQDCINPESPNSFYNEFLNSELREHRKFLEALGSKLKIEATDEQLSGVGFSLTRRNEVTLKVVGKTTRIIKIKF